MKAPVRQLVNLGDVPAVLDDLGYGEFLSALSPHQVHAERWVLLASSLDGPMRALVGLLLLNEEVPASSLPEEMTDVVPVLEQAGLCECYPGGRIRLPGLVLLRLCGFWILVGRPRVSSTLYVGDDSLALAHRIAVRDGGTALDLCAGPGLQALVCSLRSPAVTAVEVNPVAAALAAVNVALNRMTGVVSVRCGDLYDAVGSQRFDTIVANPPLVAIPADLPYPFVGHGGGDGMRVTWRILRGLDEHLSESGVAQLIGTTLSDGLLPLPLPALERWASHHGFHATMTITAHAPAGPDSSWSAGVTATIAEHARGHVQLTEDELAARYRQAAASHVCAYFLRLRRGRGSLTLLDLSETGDEFWFA